MKNIRYEAYLCGKWLLIGAAFGFFIIVMFQLEQVGFFEPLKNLPPPDYSDYPWEIWWLFYFILMG